MDEISSFKGIGSIVAWPKLNSNGVPIGFDADTYHECNGDNIPADSKYDKIRALIGNKFPLVDYCVIQIREVLENNQEDIDG